jgi:hypothetical protein
MARKKFNAAKHFIRIVFCNIKRGTEKEYLLKMNNRNLPISNKENLVGKE